RRGVAGRGPRDTALVARPRRAGAVRPYLRRRVAARHADRARVTAPEGRDLARARDGPSLALARTHRAAARGRDARPPRGVGLVRAADRRRRDARVRARPPPLSGP